MGALKYIKGGLRNLLNPGVSFLSRIDDVSEVSPKAKVYGKTQIYQSQIDDYSYVASGTQVICTKIGKFCSIADDVILVLEYILLVKYLPLQFSQNTTMQLARVGLPKL